MNEITDNLWIGDINDVRTQSTEQFDRVITVCQDSVGENVGCKYQHFNMADGRVDQYGGESNFGLFGKATGAVVDAVKRDERVLVHCHKGESRSAAVCIAAVGTIHEVPYAEAFRRVAAVRDIYPHPVLGAYAQRYIEQNG